MEYIKTDNNIVIELISTSNDPGEGWRQVMLEGGVHVGADVRMFDENWQLRSDTELVQEGFIQLEMATAAGEYPIGTVLQKIKDGKITKKTLFDFVKEGSVSLPPLGYLDEVTETVEIASSIEELLELGKITYEAATTLKTIAAREKRNILLSELDQIIMNPLRWNSFSTEQKENFASYRQHLLDTPQQAAFPWDITWPTLPL